ncbi:hypothetical protein [Methylobrevis pamukkalensis]|uniref:hypothetical protein n=1 Tax=Methylobrevis pamukkalensis TaxID=1439726 RepID=UPI003CC9CE9B
MVGPANATALAGLVSWPEWPGPVTLLLGPAGSGKSHLAAIFAEHAGARRFAAADLAGLDPLALAMRRWWSRTPTIRGSTRPRCSTSSTPCASGAAICC